METNRIYNMDCLEGMGALAGESVDCIVTDPPYKVTTRGGHKFLGGFFANELTDKGMIFEHNDIDIEQYLPEFYRVLKDGSHCYIMCNNSNLVHFFDAVRQSEFRFIHLTILVRCLDTTIPVVFGNFRVSFHDVTNGIDTPKLFEGEQSL